MYDLVDAADLKVAEDPGVLVNCAASCSMGFVFLAVALLLGGQGLWEGRHFPSLMGVVVLGFGLRNLISTWRAQKAARQPRDA